MKRLVTYVVVPLLGLAAGCGAAGPKELKLAQPPAQTVEAGGSARVNVEIDRVNFSEPVKVWLEGLPAGVEVKENEIVLGPESEFATFMLSAAATAPPVEGHRVRVMASVPDVVEIGQRSEFFLLTVK